MRATPTKRRGYTELLQLKKPVCLFAFDACVHPQEAPALVEKKRNLRRLLRQRHQKMLKFQGLDFKESPCKRDEQNAGGAENPPDAGCIPPLWKRG